MKNKEKLICARLTCKFARLIHSNHRSHYLINFLLLALWSKFVHINLLLQADGILVKLLNFIVSLYSARSLFWFFCAELTSLQNTLFILECCLLLPLLLNIFRNYLLLDILAILRLKCSIRHGAKMLILKIKVAMTTL